MALFGFHKKTNDTKPASPATTPVTEPAPNGTLSIKVLGSGCASCHALYENTKAAVEKASLPAEVAYITDMQTILATGIMRMPALTVNGKVIAMGVVLKPDDIQKKLAAFMAENEAKHG